MNSFSIACTVFACTFTGTLFGVILKRILPDGHLNSDSKDAVKQGLALIGTLTALVLGLLVATTKGTYDAQSAAVKEMASSVALLDRVLVRYGPETKACRQALPKLTKSMLDEMWPDGGPARLMGGEARVTGEAMFDDVASLEPKTDAQRMLKARALEIAIGMAQTRQRLVAQRESSIPTPFLVVLAFWLTLLFASYSLLAPINPTVFIVLTVCMISVAGAVLLILEMDRPFDGIIRVPSAPLRDALTRLGE